MKRPTLILVAIVLSGCGETAPTPAPPATGAKPLEEFKLIVKRAERVQNKRIHQTDRKSLEASLETQLAVIRTMPPGKNKKDLEKKIEEDRVKFETGFDWIVWHHYVTDLTFDVQKTDSLVSPFTAHIDFTSCVASTGWLTKAQAQAEDVGNRIEKVETYDVRAEYAYQDGKWVRTSLLEKGNDDLGRKIGWKKPFLPMYRWVDLDKALTP